LWAFLPGEGGENWGSRGGRVEGLKGNLYEKFFMPGKERENSLMSSEPRSARGGKGGDQVQK